MFYCEECRLENGWPEGYSVSHGPCECCGKTKLCFDVPSRALPTPKPAPKPIETKPAKSPRKSAEYHAAYRAGWNDALEAEGLKKPGTKKSAKVIASHYHYSVNPGETCDALGCPAEYIAKCKEFPSLSFIDKSAIKATAGIMKTVQECDYSPRLSGAS